MIAQFDRENYWLVILALGLLIFSVFYNLGLVPLYLEEPRRALIALEMIFNDNIWVPTEFGEYYYKKPPIFNWIIILGFKTFGEYSEFAARFFSIVSYLLTGAVTYLLGSKFIDRSFGIYSAFVFYISADLLFYFTVTSGEIDLFYSLVTFSAMAVTLYCYLNNQFAFLFISSYLLTAIGFLTKGIPSLVFQITTLLALFWSSKDMKLFFSKSHFIGIVVFLIPVLAYTFIYGQWNSFLNYFNTQDSLLTQSTERTFLFNNIGSTVFGILSFPLLLLKILAPGSLFIFFLFRKSSLKHIRNSKFLRLVTIVLIANIIIYWVSPGTRSRYLYMFFPLFAILFMGLVYQIRNSKRVVDIWTLSQNAVFLILILLTGYLLFDERTREQSNIIIVVSLGITTFLILVFLHHKKKEYRFFLFIISIIVARLIFSFSVLPVRAETGMKAESKQHAYKILEVVQKESLYLYKESQISRTSIFYLERELGKVVSFNNGEKSGFQIVRFDYWSEFPNLPHLYDFDYNDQQYAVYSKNNDH